MSEHFKLRSSDPTHSKPWITGAIRFAMTTVELRRYTPDFQEVIRRQRRRVVPPTARARTGSALRCLRGDYLGILRPHLPRRSWIVIKLDRLQSSEILWWEVCLGNLAGEH